MSLHASRIFARVTFGSSAIDLLQRVALENLFQTRQTCHCALFGNDQVWLSGVSSDHVRIIFAGLACGNEGRVSEAKIDQCADLVITCSLHLSQAVSNSLSNRRKENGAR